MTHEEIQKLYQFYIELEKQTPNIGGNPLVKKCSCTTKCLDHDIYIELPQRRK